MMLMLGKELLSGLTVLVRILRRTTTHEGREQREHRPLKAAGMSSMTDVWLFWFLFLDSKMAKQKLQKQKLTELEPLGNGAYHIDLCRSGVQEVVVWTAFTSAYHSEGLFFGPEKVKKKLDTQIRTFQISHRCCFCFWHVQPWNFCAHSRLQSFKI